MFNITKVIWNRTWPFICHVPTNGFGNITCITFKGSNVHNLQGSMCNLLSHNSRLSSMHLKQKQASSHILKTIKSLCDTNLFFSNMSE